MNARERLAYNVKALRKHLGLSQKELADASFLNTAHIGNIENSRAAATIDVIEAISFVLKIDVCLLLGKPIVKFPNTNIDTQQLFPGMFREGEAAFCFWTKDGMEFHPLAKNSVRTAITMLALLQGNGITGKDLILHANKFHIPHPDLE